MSNLEELQDYIESCGLEKECCGCGRLLSDIVIEEGIIFDELEDLGCETNSGSWFCHEDCLRDSGGAIRWGGV